jgi:hypothetical protein
MTDWRRCSSPSAGRARLGAFLVCPIILAILATFATPSSGALPSTTAHDSSYFAGYVAPDVPLVPVNSSISEISASASFNVPTMTCTYQDKDLVLVISQEIESLPPNGGSAGGIVTAECSGGVPTYSGGAFACGTNSSERCFYCPASPGISAGDSVFVSASLVEDSSDPMDSVVKGGVSDSSSSASASCQNTGAFNTADKLYTGICGEGNNPRRNQLRMSGASVAPPDAGCELGNRPEFSPVTFTGIGADGTSLSSWNPKRYDMVAGTTLQVKSGNLKEQGESFKDVFVQH